MNKCFTYLNAEDLKEKFVYYLDKNIELLDRVFDQNRRREFLRLDLNENPGGLPELFLQNVLSEITPQFVAEYPETLEFSEVLARYLGTTISQICLVNGSAEGIRYIIQAFTSIGGKILGVSPTYAMFEVFSRMYGRTFIPVEYTDDLEMPVERIIKMMTEDVQLLILVNPNNPIGNVYSEEEFEAIFKKAQELEITILVDEAYHYFYPMTFMRYAIEKEHVFVTRTFSKLFSLAGARLGYVVGWPQGISVIQKLCTPHNVNAFAQLLAQRIIEAPNLIEGLISRHKEGREYLLNMLREYNYCYYGETGNFIFIKPKTNPIELVSRMKTEKRILIKAYNNVGKFGDCLRITTGERQYMEQFFYALRDLES